MLLSVLIVNLYFMLITVPDIALLKRTSYYSISPVVPL